MEYNCPKCKESMKKSRIITYYDVFSLGMKPKKLFSNKKDHINSYVCPRCGYIELYVQNPQIFK
ncbi:hypothetical protein [Tepidibacter formicigenes]|jgi:predicted nucleic-acid-binding Zn-ribbon protein|uniref:Nucleic-acid-binding protein containing Zn-ribbon domain n=1 Tax=Tepidibacter formicigenes DSM 15518 TaxID=1123349 RepID=A0A1M6SBN6_9FIRM|nr:hypothetical protein [Tepidibacter formicigenes]SHK42105.1 hypothetical protein SAMN02744037_02309 [Tepidibacter formicigenes DSM 15518]